MTKLQRKLYLLFFVVLFLVTAPVIVLFAKGYRFDRTGRIFVYSGSITIKSWPRDIDIYVNNKKQDRKKLNAINNSYTINGVRPGKYSVRSEKNGYTSWTKNIEVHSGISTEFWNVILFPTKNREITSHPPQNVNQFFLSPRDDDEIVFFTSQDDDRIVSLLNSDNNEFEEIYRTNQFEFIDTKEKENVEWSSDNKRILIPFIKDDQKNYVIARIRKENLRDIIDLDQVFDQALSEFQENQVALDEQNILEEEQHETTDFSSKFRKVRWMFDKNDELVILTDDHRLYYFNIEDPNNIILLDENVSGFDFAGNRIYYTQLPNNIVWEIKDDNTKSKKQITNTSISPNDQEFLKLTVYDQYRVAVITHNNDLYVYNKEKEKGEMSLGKIMENADDIQFSDDGKKLLYWSSNEIWCLMLREWEVQPLRSKGDRIFITRLSNQINNVQWMDDYENIIFSSDKFLKSASIDNRDHSNIVDVIQLDRKIINRDLMYSKSTQRLFYINKQNDQSVLQSSLLIDKTGFLGF